MKKFGLVALLSLLTLGVAACGGNNDSSKPASVPSTPSTPSTPAPSVSTPAPSVSTPAPSVSTPEVETKELPVAWEEGETFQALECSVSLIPGSIADKADATITNADAASLKDFLNLEGARYIDLRDVSEGYGIGHIAGFESISYFRLIEGAGHLFTNVDGTFVANYEESEAILNTLFPKDMTYFVMCQVGGRVQPFLMLLSQYGYNMDNVYNIGGWNQLANYKGDLGKFAGYDVALGLKAAATEYDFSDLTPVASEEENETKEVRRAADLPIAWEEGETFQALESSISLVPGSIADKADATITNADALPVSDFLTTEGIRFIDLRDVSEGYGIGHIAGFETISYFKLIEGAGHLFTNVDGTFVANYEESEAILNTLFPKDMTYFVMCQVGGRVQPFLTLLSQYGYNMDNIYNIGGWNQLANYKGDLGKFAGYDVALGLKAAATEYDFSDLTAIAAE